MVKASFKGYSDFQAAHTRAKWAACYELGEHWKRVPGASVLAAVEAADADAGLTFTTKEPSP